MTRPSQCPPPSALRPIQRLALSALLLVGALWYGAPLAYGFGFNVDPARIELTVPAGKRRGKTVTINNTRSKEALHLTIYLQDVIYLPDGTHEFPPAGSTTWSCANWVQATPKELDVPAGGAADVRVSVTAPKDASGGHYAVMFFETRPSYTEDGVGVNFRLGSLVEVVVPGTGVTQAKIANLTIKPPQQLVVDIFNEGNVLIRPGGKIKILDESGKRLSQLEFNTENLGILPKTLRSFTIKLDPPLARGQYRIKAEIDYGSRQLLVGELPVAVP